MATVRADARANQAAIVDAAACLFAERGLDVAFEEIATAAGVGRATVYRHYPTRDDLLVAIFERLVEDLEAKAAALPEGDERFMALFRLVVATQTSTLPLVQLLPPQPELPPGLIALRARMHALFREPLAEAQAAGLVRPGLAAEDVRVLVAMLTAVVRPGTSDEDRARAWQLAERALILRTSEPRPRLR